MQQKRKHLTQMSYDEINYIVRRLAKFTTPRFTYHAQERIEEKCRKYGISMDDIEQTLLNGYIVEANNIVEHDIRVLLRFSPARKEEDSCIVVSLRTGYIITVYSNSRKDAHRTLDWDKYRLDDNIIELTERVLSSLAA